MSELQNDIFYYVWVISGLTGWIPLFLRDENIFKNRWFTFFIILLGIVYACLLGPIGAIIEFCIRMTELFREDMFDLNVNKGFYEYKKNGVILSYNKKLYFRDQQAEWADANTGYKIHQIFARRLERLFQALKNKELIFEEVSEQ